MSDHFQPPMKKEGNHHNPFQHLWEMVGQFFDERPLKNMMETLDEYFQQTFSHAYIPVDFRETKDEFAMIVHLPDDVKRHQLQLQFANDHLQLVIQSNEIIETADEQNHLYQQRRMRQQIVRTIPLPYRVSEKEVKASWQNGKLVIRLPQKRKYIDIE
ncbi:Hsp20/alpha crystallin family protein [Parageobacillus thermoglucosidasius]|uniref:Hsp20/alpha crystallin family protein n=1 Tax=Parageobacillus thermoglucosidasius TaxID=1426 RepID=UPI003B681FE0